MDPVEMTVLLGLAAGGLATVIRVLPWPEAWKRRKPLACALCMGFWSTLLLVDVGLYFISIESLLPIHGLVGLGAVGLAAYLNHAVLPPTIELPE